MINRVDESVWLRRGQSGKRRTVAIVGGMHGDEPDGATVVDELNDPNHPVWTICRDEVWLVRGNPEALEKGTRGSTDGADLNRLFAVEPPEGDGYETARAHALRKWLKPVDALLDLHQTVTPLPPLAVIRDTPGHLAEVHRLGVPMALVGSDLVYGGSMLSNLIDRSGGVGVLVQTGARGGKRTLEQARSVAVRFLTGSQVENPVHVIEVLEVVACPGPGLSFNRPLSNFTEVRAGEPIATWEGGEVRLQQGGIAFQPREHADPGQPCLLVARERGTA